VAEGPGTVIGVDEAVTVIDELAQEHVRIGSPFGRADGGVE